MANEPERPIEQLLRAAAKKRREEAGAPFELHAADRRLLQGEVARQFARGQAEPRASLPLLVRLWPRLAWAAAIFAVLVVGVSLLVPGPARLGRERMLAGVEEMQATRQAKALPTAPEAASAPRAGEREAAAPANLPTVAYTRTAQPAPRSPAGQPARQSYAAAPASPAADSLAAPQLVAKDSLVTKSGDNEQGKLALAPAPALEDRGREMPMAAPGAAATPPAAKLASHAFQPQEVFVPTPAHVAGGSAVPAPAPPVATAPAGPLVVTAEPASRSLDESATTARSYKALAAAAPANRPKAAWAGTDGVAASGAALAAQKSFGVSQRFLQVAAAPGAKAGYADKAKAARPVLVSFQVEQAGRELRLTDEDGSVYKGYLQVADAAQSNRRLRSEAPAAARTANVVNGALDQAAASNSNLDQLGPQNYAFRVAGTNRTLRKKVVFTGNLIATSNLIVLPPSATNRLFGSLLGNAAAGSAQTGILPLSNARITGKVQVGSGKAVEINALPAQP